VARAASPGTEESLDTRIAQLHEDVAAAIRVIHKQNMNPAQLNAPRWRIAGV
jgi:hypothetical protein